MTQGVLKKKYHGFREREIFPFQPQDSFLIFISHNQIVLLVYILMERMEKGSEVQQHILQMGLNTCTP